MDISTKKITLNTLKNVNGNNVDISAIEITPKKVRENDVDFRISKITLKKYVEMTRKFVEIYYLRNWRNIDVESTSIWRGVSVGMTLLNTYDERLLWK